MMQQKLVAILGSLLVAQSCYCDVQPLDSYTLGCLPLACHTARSILVVGERWTKLDFKGVSSVEDQICIAGNENLVEVDLQALETVKTGDFQFMNNPKVVNLTLPMLQSCYAFVLFGGQFTQPLFPMLTNTRELKIDKNPKLTRVDFPSLLTTTDVDIRGNALLKKAYFQKLTKVAGYLSVVSNDILEIISMNVMQEVTGPINVTMISLSEVNFRSLKQVGGPSIVITTPNNGCVDLSCLNTAVKTFDVTCKGAQRTAIPLCSSNKTWGCSCPPSGL